MKLTVITESGRKVVECQDLKLLFKHLMGRFKECFVIDGDVMYMLKDHKIIQMKS